MIMPLLGTVCFGLAVGIGWYAAGDSASTAFVHVESDLSEKLRRLRLHPTNLKSILVGWLICIAGTILLVGLFLGMPVIGLTIGILMVSLPWYTVRRLSEIRRMKIEDQLADAMVSLSSAIKAGLSLAQALEILAQQMPRPICQEFQQITGEYKLGKPLEVCLKETKTRLRSENFALFAAAMEASRQSGGRLNDTVERIAHSVRELQRLERKIHAETAQARSSATYMAMAPFAVLLLYYLLVDPVNTERLFTTFWGQMMLSAAVLLDVIAYLWARVILNPEI